MSTRPARSRRRGRRPARHGGVPARTARSAAAGRPVEVGIAQRAGPGRGRRAWSSSTSARRWFGRYAGLAHENPLYQRWLRTRDGRAYRFSDVTAARSWRRPGSTARSTRRSGSLPDRLRYPPSRPMLASLHREDRDFTDGERDLLNRARPFLIQAYRNALAYSGLRRRIGGGARRRWSPRG